MGLIRWVVKPILIPCVDMDPGIVFSIESDTKDESQTNSENDVRLTSNRRAAAVSAASTRKITAGETCLALTSAA